MSNISVVWLDLENAKIFHFSDERMERETLHATRVDHHTHRRDNDEKDSVNMYDDLARRISKSSKVLILGPGVAKDHFSTRLRENFPDVAKKVVACEAADHPSDAQIASYALRYFRKPVA